MQFNSYVFIMAYLPILVIGYFICNKISLHMGKVFLILGSTVFYLYGGITIALVFGCSIALNLFFSHIIRKKKEQKKMMLALAVIVNIGILFYYKYSNFFVENINRILHMNFREGQNIVLPLGISFFTFQQIAYVVGVYRNEIDKISCTDYLVYITYFPKLLMGPLAEPTNLITQINDKKLKSVNWDNLANGIKLFSFGLFKKMILADTFSQAVNWGYTNINSATSMDWILIMLFYTFQIYFDFSGYTDMAVGVSCMLNIELPMNFNSPYKALSIRDFWKRWHITLTGFLTKYIYIPFGGNRRGTIRTYLNILIVFLVSGIWHGANWTFVLWGVLHGILSVLDRVFEKFSKRLIEPVRWMATFLAVNCLWMLFRSDSIAQWHQILYNILTFQDTSVSGGLISSFDLPEGRFIRTLLHLEAVNSSVRGFSMLLFMCSALFLCLIPENNYQCRKKNNAFTMFLAAIAFIWGLICLSSESVFVYFNF